MTTRRIAPYNQYMCKKLALRTGINWTLWWTMSGMDSMQVKSGFLDSQQWSKQTEEVPTTSTWRELQPSKCSSPFTLRVRLQEPQWESLIQELNQELYTLMESKSSQISGMTTPRCTERSSKDSAERIDSLVFRTSLSSIWWPAAMSSSSQETLFKLL